MKCQMCRSEMVDNTATEDCGGDCLRCMAICGDPDAQAAMLALYGEEPEVPQGPNV